MNILDTLQFMKPNIKVVVWENDINKIQYHELETYRPTKADILAVKQTEVNSYRVQKDKNIADSTVTVEELMAEILDLKTKLTVVKADVDLIKAPK